MKMLTIFPVLLALVFCRAEERVNFTGHKVYEILPNSEDDVEFLRQMSKRIPELDVWTDVMIPGTPVDMHFTPEQEAELLREVEERGMITQVKIEDLEEAVRNQVATPFYSSGFALDQYHTLSEIEAYITEIADSSNLVTAVAVGRSFHGRTIRALRITTDASANRPKVWMDGGIHAREWVSPATMLYFIDYFVNGYGRDSTVTNILDHMDLYILPVFNVDGYVYTWTTNRMWRKTLSPNAGYNCLGTDPNRNWDFQWSAPGADSYPCSEAYHGSAPFSEVEVSSVADFIESLDNIKLFLNYHSYSQFYMFPWGYTTSYPADYDEFYYLTQKATTALYQVHGSSYQFNSISKLVGRASGSSVDWGYGALGIKHSYGVELRDRGRYGFLLPANQIIPNAEENLAALLVLIDHVMNN